MSMKRRPPAFRKTDLIPVLEAAKMTGYDHVSVSYETEDGRRFLISANTAQGKDKAEQSALEKWRGRKNAN